MSMVRILAAAMMAGATLFGTLQLALAADTDVPAANVSKRIDAIKARGSLKVGVIGEFPWLKENTSGEGAPFEGPAWLLANDYAQRLGVKLETVAVSHETKVPILATGQVDITIAPLSLTDARKKVVDFVVYSKSTICLFGKQDNPKLSKVDAVDGLDTPDITIAYYTGTPPETWLPTRFKSAILKGVPGSGANAPVDEIMSGRADIAPIDTVAWIDLAKKVPGLISFPKGDECLTKGEFPSEVGMAIDKNQPEFLSWLRAVAAQMQDKVSAEELRVLKE
jgi:polar amino acid transport system substrate-binding protein